MPDHLSRERIAALIDEPEARGSERDHLDRCEECTVEFEQMVRTRMALSALPDLEPPVDEWRKIESRLSNGISRIRVPARPAMAWGFRPLWAAAVVALFAAGLGVGRQLSQPGPETMDPVATATPGGTNESAVAYLRSVAQLQELREEGPSAEAIREDPSLAAERLMRLDALIEASQEALRAAPTDPVLNNFLFDVVDERQTVAGQMNRSLRQASVEY